MLSDIERQILDFEKITFRYTGSKEDQIRERFGLSPTRYYQRLATLIDRPEALAYAPSTVKRLTRLREQRQRARNLSH